MFLLRELRLLDLLGLRLLQTVNFPLQLINLVLYELKLLDDSHMERHEASSKRVFGPQASIEPIFLFLMFVFEPLDFCFMGHLQLSAGILFFSDLLIQKGDFFLVLRVLSLDTLL